MKRNVGFEHVNAIRHHLPSGEQSPAGDGNLISPNCELRIIGTLDGRTECGNKWSPASVDEFSRTAEKYYTYKGIMR